jgi:NADPH-dependent ferric siderophore reductase
MNQGPRSPVRVRYQSQLRLVQVARVERLSPRMRRVIFTGETLDGFIAAGADDHVKLFFPAPGQDKPTLPTPGAHGITFPDGAIRPASRNYTPRGFDPQKRELSIEFVIHGDGPASSWAAQATAGQWVGVGGPRGSYLAPDDYDTYLLAGDETALPAIARYLEEMRPDARALVLIEVADRSEERQLPTAANAAIIWLHRDGIAPGTPTLLEQALGNLMLPRVDVFAWLAGETETVRRLRRYLIEEQGLSRNQLRAAGYWRIGEAGAHARLDDDILESPAALAAARMPRDNGRAALGFATEESPLVHS